MSIARVEPIVRSVKATFSELYAIDPDTLQLDEKRLHQAALNAAYLALLELENRQLEQKLQENESLLQHLQTATEAVETAMRKQDKLVDRLCTVARGLEAVVKLVG
ncbi:MAG: hypothetical protein HC848_04285 [Limnobacter sp.]|nr:hypothetical protein [Limnobacter sp.]